MRHLQMRFVLMVCLFFASQRLISHSSLSRKKSGMEISRFSRSFLLNHPDRVGTMQVTESFRISSGSEKVSKVISTSSSSSSSSTLGSSTGRRISSKRKSRSGRTAQEFQMRREKSSSTQIEKEWQTCAETGKTLGTTDQQRDPCLPHVPTPITGQRNDNHGDREEYTHTKLTGSHDTSKSFPFCQKLSFVHEAVSNFTLYGFKEEKKEVVRKSVSAQVEKRLGKIPLVDDQDHPHYPIFFVYPVPFLTKMDHHRTEPKFFQEYSAFINHTKRTARLIEFDSRIMGGFHSYDLDVSFYWNDGWDDVVNNLESGKAEKGEKRTKSNTSSSTYDELCKALLGFE